MKDSTVLLTPGRLCGTVDAPPSKSAAHRGLLCAALAALTSPQEGPSTLAPLALSADIAATLGAETDRLLRRAAVTDMSRAVILQACAASLLERYCDQCCREIGEQAAGEGLYLRPRFSPGYGDFPITFQRALLEALEAPKRIGLTATGAMMLTPAKSVTAVVGLSPDGRYTRPGGCGDCGSCPRTTCPYRLE